MTNKDDDLREALFELNSFAGSGFDSFYCQECNLPLKDYGYDSYPFGENDFADLLFCGKCAADYCGEEDYHCERLKNDSETIVLKFNKIESLANIFPLSAQN